MQQTTLSAVFFLLHLQTCSIVLPSYTALSSLTPSR